MSNEENTKPPTPETHAGRSASDGVDSSREDRQGKERTDEGTRGSLVDRIKGCIEALLLAADQPLEVGTIADTVREHFDDATDGRVRTAIERLRLDLSGDTRGIHLEKVSGGLELRTNPAYGEVISSYVERSPISLSRAALETLAIVAYRQPITRADVEEIRGVNSQGVLRTLEEARLVDVVGQLDDIGQPHLYGTTNRFLETFGLEDLTDLPTLTESERDSLEELYDDELEAFDEEFE